MQNGRFLPPIEKFDDLNRIGDEPVLVSTGQRKALASLSYMVQESKPAKPDGKNTSAKNDKPTKTPVAEAAKKDIEELRKAVQVAQYKAAVERARRNQQLEILTAQQKKLEAELAAYNSPLKQTNVTQQSDQRRPSNESKKPHRLEPLSFDKHQISPPPTP